MLIIQMLINNQNGDDNMSLRTNTIISLENNEKYVVLNETMYGGTKYFLVMGVDDNKDVIPTNVAIVEEIIDGQDTYVDRVKDPELIIILTRNTIMNLFISFNIT